MVRVEIYDISHIPVIERDLRNVPNFGYVTIRERY